MREVVSNLLWLGHALDVRNPRAILQAEIAAVVDLAYEEPPAALPREIVYLRVPLLDGKGNDRSKLRLAVSTAAELLTAKTRTLIGCGAGMSRSPVIAAAALALHRKASIEPTLATIVQGAPHDVSLPLLQDVLQVCSEWPGFG